MEQFEQFYAEAEPKLRRALVAAFGALRGRDATVDALSYAWEHWEEVRVMHHPIAYLFRVGQTRTHERNRRILFPAPADVGMPWVEPALPTALSQLSEHQRVAVVLAHGFGWTHREVAEVLDVSTSTVQNHVERAMAKLRAALEVNAND